MFFFDYPAATDIYTLSLHDALPIYRVRKVVPITEPGTREPSEAEQTRSGTRIRIWIECSARLSSEISSLPPWRLWPYGILIAYVKLSPSQSRGRGNRARPSRPDQERGSGSVSNVFF